MSKLFWVLLLSAAMIFSFVLSMFALNDDNYPEATFWLVLVVFNSMSLDRVTREN